MINHAVVSHDEWLQAGREFLDQEKAFTHERDRINVARLALPWERVEQEYVFSGSRGDVALADLFQGCRQLIVYHFMFPPEWDAGCPHCSFWADNFDGIPPHLQARDTAFAAISRAP